MSTASTMTPPPEAPTRVAPPLCPRCACPDTATVHMYNGPDYAITQCLSCARHLRSEPFPMTFARAADHVIRLGQHKGSTVAVSGHAQRGHSGGATRVGASGGGVIVEASGIGRPSLCGFDWVYMAVTRISTLSGSVDVITRRR